MKKWNQYGAALTAALVCLNGVSSMPAWAETALPLAETMEEMLQPMTLSYPTGASPVALQPFSCDETAEDEMVYVGQDAASTDTGSSLAALKTCNTDYGYQALGLCENGAKLQKLYQLLDSAAEAFWENKSDYTKPYGSYTDKFLVKQIQFSDLKLSADEIIRTYCMFRLDKPLYYFVSSTLSYSNVAQRINFFVETEYRLAADRQRVQERIETGVMELAAVMADEVTDYEKLLALHDRINDRIDYAYMLVDGEKVPSDAPWAHNITGYFDDYRYGVCECYAKVFQLMTNYVGIENVLVTGLGVSSEHAWNMAKVDGTYYYFDCTWDDSQDSRAYFAAGSDTFLLDHTAHTPSETGVQYLYPIPVGSEIAYGADFVATEFTDGDFDYRTTMTGVMMTSYHGKDTAVTVPATVKGYRVTEVGYHAFADNSKIKSITFSEGLKMIAAGFAYNCVNLTSISIPATANFDRNGTVDYNEVGDLVFGGGTFPALFLDACNSLRSITVAAGNPSLLAEDGVLYTADHSILICYPPAKTDTQYTVHADTKMILTSAFEQCTNLQSVTLPDTLQRIRNWAFYGCTALASLTLPKECDAVYQYAFTNCGIRTLTIPKEFTGMLMYNNLDVNPIETITVEEGNPMYAVVDDALIQGGSKLLVYATRSSREIYIMPEGITEMMMGAFRGATNLKEAYLLGSITQLPTRVFAKCPALEYVFVPKTVTNISTYPFESDSGCQLYYGGTTTQWKAVTGYSRISPATLHCNDNPSHTPVEAVFCIREPSCIVMGTQWEICRICGEKTETTLDYTSHKDADGNNLCDVCDVLIDVQHCRVMGHSLTLDGMIGVNFYFYLSDAVQQAAGAYVAFTVDGETTTMSVAEAIAAGPSIETAGVSAYRFPCMVTSVQMATSVTAALYPAEGEKPLLTDTYSAQTYGMEAAESMDGSYGELVKAMLNYGACAQIFFDSDVEHLANAGLSTADQIPEPMTNEEVTALSGFLPPSSNGSFGIRLAGTTLALHSATCMNFYFTLCEGSEIAQYHFTCGDVELPVTEKTMAGRQMYCVSVDNIHAAMLSQTVTLAVSDGADSMEIPYSAYDYIASCMYMDDGALQNLATALYRYSQAAEKAILP